MRTTLDLDSDVLDAAKEIARREQITAGQLISRLLRERLTGGAAGPVAPAASAVTAAGFRQLPSRGVIVNNDLVNRLRDQEGV